MSNEPETPTERVAMALAEGAMFTPAMLAKQYGMTTRGAKVMLHRISKVLPLRNKGGIWRVDRRLEK